MSEREHTIVYVSWLSTHGEDQEYKAGCAFAGLVRDVPHRFAALLDPPDPDGRKYCIIRKKESL